MKFTCERCGKKYATAEDPTPGRVYKVKCRACGHLIVVRSSATRAGAAPAQANAGPGLAGAAATSPARGFDASAHSAATPIADLAPAGTAGSPPPTSHDTPSLTLEVGTPEPARIPGNGSPREAAFELPPDLATEALRDPHALEHTPTRGDSGYLDLFSDVSGLQALPAKPSEDPFVAAARASLPDGYGSGSSSAPDPFADLRLDISATSEPQRPRAPPPVPKLPVIPRPQQERSHLPIVLIGSGVAVMVGILAFVLLSSGKKSAPVAASARPAAPPVAAPAPPLPGPPQIAQPELPIATPAPPASPPERSDAAPTRAEQKRREREEEKARAERDAREREAKAQAKADREAKERTAAEARERERAARQAAAAAEASGDADGGLTQAQIEGVLRSTKPGFDGCIRAARGGDVVLDGRRVMLRLDIQSNGTVTHPTLDDVTLNSTEVGTCLKSAARLMVFPKFQGDTRHVEVPLVMR